MRNLAKSEQFSVQSIEEIKDAIDPARTWLRRKHQLNVKQQDLINAVLLRWLELPEEMAVEELRAALGRLRERLASESHPIVRAAKVPLARTARSGRGIADDKPNSTHDAPARSVKRR